MYSKILPEFEFLKRPENIPPNNDQQKTKTNNDRFSMPNDNH